MRNPEKKKKKQKKKKCRNETDVKLITFRNIGRNSDQNPELGSASWEQRGLKTLEGAEHQLNTVAGLFTHDQQTFEQNPLAQLQELSTDIRRTLVENKECDWRKICFEWNENLEWIREKKRTFPGMMTGWNATASKNSVRFLKIFSAF